MEQHLGRKLRPDEIVHHRDGNKRNNDMQNLGVMALPEHTSFHMKNRILSTFTKEKLRNSVAAKTSNAKLRPEDIGVIRKMLKDKIEQFLIALAYGVSIKTIRDISIGRVWSWV